MQTLREARIGKLLSIRALAETAHVAPWTIQRIESGQYLPRLLTMRKISTALGIEPLAITEFRRAMEAASEGKEAA